MPLNPETSFITKDAVLDTTFTKTMLIVGQSNVATEGLYKDIQLKTVKEVNTLFGEDSHITSCIKDALSAFSNSIVKPIIWAISYLDEVTAVAKIIDSQVTGTSTENKTIKIILNSLNPDRTATKTASVLALRNTKGAYCGDFARNTIEFGSPVNARRSFNPIFNNPFLNDVVIEVPVTIGMTAAQIAVAINTAINDKTDAIYSSTVLVDVLTITSKHKGALSNMFGFEIVSNTIPNGVSISSNENTAGSGVVDISGILDIEDDESNKLRNLDFNYLVMPFGYSTSELVLDSMAKFTNVLEFNNQCLEYYIIRGTALDLTDDISLNALAVAEPIELNGLCKILQVSELDGLRIRGTWEYLTRKKIENKQFTPVQREINGKITIGNSYTLSDSIGFSSLSRTLASFTVREIFVEKFIPRDFQEADFTDGDFTDSSTYNRDEIISMFQYYRDILDGTILTSEFGNDFATLVSNSEEAKTNYNELLDSSVNYDKITESISMKIISKLINPIKSIFTVSSYN